jgi:hypothetical protein
MSFGGEFMGDDLSTMIAEAEEGGAQSLGTEPRARAAPDDRRPGRVHVDLANGGSFAFPARQAQGLERASDAELAQVKILGVGHGLHWECLDVDLSVPGLLAGVFGTEAYASLGRTSGPGANRTRRDGGMT